MAPPVPHCLDRDAYLPLKDMRFGLQDYHLKQLQKTLAYAKALQYWAELAKSTPPDKPHQLAECIQELREWMEPFITFTEAEVFKPVEPSNWVQITPSKSTETVEPPPPWECSHSRKCQARTRGKGLTRGMGCSKPLVIPSMVSTSTLTISSQKTGAPNIFTQWVKTPPESPGTQRWMPLPRFAGIATSSPKVDTSLESTRAPLWTPLSGLVEIASTLRRSQSSRPLPVEEQALPQVVGSTMVVSRMVQDTWGMTTIDMMTCQLHVMGLEPTQPSSITISEMPTLEDASESEGWRQWQQPPSDFTSVRTMFLYHWQLSALILCKTVFFWGVLAQ